VIIGIHQPNFMPWFGFFRKLVMADIFVLLDDVQFTKGGYQNRVQIKGPNGPVWLTLPIKKGGSKSTNEISLNYGTSWHVSHLKTIEGCYSKAPFFDDAFEMLSRLYETTNPELMVDFNLIVLKGIMDYLSLSHEKLVFASGLGIEGQSTGRLVEICRTLGGTAYLSGLGGKKYQDESLFVSEGLEIKYMNEGFAPYTQLWGDYIPGLSILDGCFNLDKDSLKLHLGMQNR
jgi:hypothetical protein